MPLPVTVYRWDDAGAPSIADRKPSDLINILKKCLVEGYGEKQPLGWSVAFEDESTTQIMFKNNTAQGGSGGFVKFWAQTTNDTSKMVQLCSASSATSLTDLFNVGYIKYLTIKSYIDSWVVIGTARSFYILLSNKSSKMAGTTAYTPTLFIGDIEAAINADAGQFIVGAPFFADSIQASPSWNNSLDYMSNGGQSFAAKVYDADSHNNSETYCAFLPFGHGSSSTYPTEVFSEIAFTKIPFVIKYSGYGKDVLTTDRFGESHSESLTTPQLRGFIPGMVQSLGAGGKNLTWPQVQSLDGVEYWMLRNANANYTDRFIRLDSWY